MKKTNSSKHEKISGNILRLICLIFLLLSGALMIFYPSGSLQITAIAIGIVLCLIGIKNIVSFFTSPVEKTMNSLSIGTGLFAIFCGILVLAGPQEINGLIRYAWSIALLIGSFFKLQIGFTLTRIKAKRWWLAFILAAASMATGMISFFALSPSMDPEKPMILFGIFLWLEALMDAFGLIFLNKSIKTMDQSPASGFSSAAGTSGADPTQTDRKE